MTETLAEDAVKRLIIASAPERHMEFESLWNEFSPQIEFTEDRGGFSLEAGAFGLILFNHKSMSQIWLLGFAAQYALHAYSPYLFLSEFLQIPISSNDFQDNQESKQVIKQASNLLSQAIELNGLISVDEFSWPQNVPSPSMGKPKDVNGGMVFDLLCMGGGYCFLHEIKHIIFKNTNQAIEPHSEEMQCDAFAREFLLGNISAYSQETGHDIEAVKTKRAMSIGLTSLLLLVLTPNSQWFGSDSHPPIVDRITALTDYLELHESSYFWSYLSCILLLIMEHYNIEFSCSAISSQKKFSLFLMEKLNEGI